MALKRKLETLEGLDQSLHSHYVQVDGGFVLQIEGDEDTGALKRAKDHEKNLRAAAEGRVAELQTQLEALAGERDAAIAERDAAKADKGKDVQALEASWQAKVDAANANLESAKNELTKEIERLLVTNTAAGIAHEISTIPELFADVVARRLKVEKGADGQYFPRVLDEAGTPSAKTLDELKQELLANKKYAAIIISSKGSGGGAGGPGSGGGAAEKRWLEYSDAELVELRKVDPEKYDRLKQAHQASPAA